MGVVGVVSLPGAPTAAREARRFVRQVIERAGLVLDDEAVGDLELCVSELTANACAHTASGQGGRVTVSVAADRCRVRVTVFDEGGAATKPQVRAEPCDESGRGLRLVEALSQTWGVHELPCGTAVWTQFTAVTSVTPCGRHGARPLG